MVRLLHKCMKCQTYTLHDTCGRCGGKAVSPHPAKFSLDDKYRRYKILMKRLSEKNQ